MLRHMVAGLGLGLPFGDAHLSLLGFTRDFVLGALGYTFWRTGRLAMALPSHNCPPVSKKQFESALFCEHIRQLIF